MSFIEFKGEESKQSDDRVIYPDPEIERDVYVPQVTPFPPELFGGDANPFDDQQQFIQILNNLQQQQQSSRQGNFNENTFAAFAQFGNFDGAAGQNPFFANMNADESPKVPETRLQKFLNTKIHIGLLAVLTYSLVLLTPFHWNIFLAFLVWEITEIFILRQHESNSGGIINILFMLGGISPTKVNIVLKWIQLLNKILRDVALFMFFFVLSHLCRSYWMGMSLVPIIESKDQIHKSPHVLSANDEIVDDGFEDFDL